MKILFLGEAESAHTQKWVLGLKKRGHQVSLFSLFPASKVLYPGVQLYVAPTSRILRGRNHNSSLTKVFYLFNYFFLRRLIKNCKPDIVHSIYATSYGLIGKLLNFKQYFITALGTDVEKFAKESYLKKLLLVKIFKSCKAVFCTGIYMKSLVEEYHSGKIIITPFGVEISKYTKNSGSGKKSSDPIKVGSLKNLEHYYGIEILIKAFAQLSKETKLRVELHIAGTGSQENLLKQLCKEEGIEHIVHFWGFIPPEEVPQFLKSLDIHVTPSLRETFGVSIIESSAAGVPVIASKIKGFEETLVPGVNGYFFEAGNVSELKERLLTLVLDRKLLEELSISAKQFALAKFNLETSLTLLEEAYYDMVKRNVN